VTRIGARVLTRIVTSEEGDFVAVFTDRSLTLRPKRSRRAGATITVTWGAIYLRALLAATPKRTRKVRRGLAR
jgi:hypothetical protein